MYSAIITGDELQEIGILVMIYHHTVILTDGSTSVRGLGCAVDKAV